MTSLWRQVDVEAHASSLGRSSGRVRNTEQEQPGATVASSESKVSRDWQMNPLLAAGKLLGSTFFVVSNGTYNVR
jgi:hypothetical protein